jgi:O-acetyl-ADP-ribose deacetylase (regulator of RNase III)
LGEGNKNMANIEVVHDSVVDQEVDAIVNAAKPTMLGGGGVDGAIHKSAGVELYNFFKNMNKRWKAGDVELSPGFNIKAKFILHAVGPRWMGGNNNEPDLLKKCYVGCLEKASQKGCRSVAFCCISVGAYRYPLELATRLALSTVKEWLDSNNSDILVKFCCYSDTEFSCYQRLASELLIA